MAKLNHKRRKKMRRKIQRRDANWESILSELILYEIRHSKTQGKVGKK